MRTVVTAFAGLLTFAGAVSAAAAPGSALSHTAYAPHYPLWGFASPTVRARRVAAWIKEMLIQTATLK